MGLTQISTKGIKDGTITGADLATNVDLVDNKKIRFGTGNDMELFHDSSNSFLKNTTGNLVIRSDNRIDFQDAAGNESFAAFIDNGAVELYHDGTKRLETSSGGVEISSALGIANVGGSIAGSGGGQDYFGIRDSAGAFALMVKTHGTSNGSVGIGTTSPNVSGFNSDANVLTLSGPKRGFIELRGNTQAADSIGGIRFFSANNLEAEILSVTDSSFNGDLRFTTNGNQRMSIDQSGRVTRPYQVAWAMHGSGGVQNLNAGDKVAFNQNGTGFGNFSNRNHGGVDTTNHSYTVPVTGLYCIIVTIFFYTDNASNICSIVPRVNNNPVDNGNDSVFLFGAAVAKDTSGVSDTNNVTSSGSVLLQLNANDEITIHRRTGEPGTNKIYTPHSHFCGYLIG